MHESAVSADAAAPAVATAEVLDDVSPTPEREKMVAVCSATGDGAPGTRVQGAACATRPGDSGRLDDTVPPTVTVGAVNDKAPALDRPKLGNVRVREAVGVSARVAHVGESTVSADAAAPVVAAAKTLDGASPAPEREKMVAVCDAAGDGAPGTRVQ